MSRQSHMGIASTVLLVLLLLAGSTAYRPAAVPVEAAAHPTPDKVVVHVSHRVVKDREHLTFFGAGFTAHEVVGLYVSGLRSPIVMVRADARGRVRERGVALPAAVTAGAHDLMFVGLTSRRTVDARLTVRAAGAVALASPLRVARRGFVIVAGEHFAPREVVTFRRAGMTAPLAVVRAGATGIVVARITVPPSAASGVQIITESGTASRHSAAVAITVGQTQPAPTMALSSATVVAGAPVVLTAHGFIAYEVVGVSINGLAGTVARLRATVTGALVARITIPRGLSAGLHTITLTGLTSQHVATALVVVSAAAATKTTTASASQPVASAATASATFAATPGSTVLLVARGFMAGEGITVVFGGVATAPIVVTAAANGEAIVRLAVPASAALGDHTITLSGLTSHRTVMQTLAVVQASAATTTSGNCTAPATTAPSTSAAATAAALNVSSTKIAQGSSVTVSGRNFAAQEMIKLTLAGSMSPLALVRASASGTFVVRIVLSPSLTAGLHLLVATGTASARTAIISVTVVATPAQSSTTMTPMRTNASLSSTSFTVTAGHMMMVAARHFLPYERVAIRLSGYARTLVVIRASARGAIAAWVMIPSGVATGERLLMALGMESHLRVTFKLTVRAAP